MKFAGCLPLHLGKILYKYELYCSLDNKGMNLYLTVRGVVKCIVYTLSI